MKFFNKRKLAVILALCGISSGKDNFTSGLTSTQKAVAITVPSILGLSISALVGYKIYKHFNPDNSDGPGKRDDDENNDGPFSQDEVKEMRGGDVPKGEIKSIEDLNKLMKFATGKLYGPSGREHSSFGSQKICKDWFEEIFKKFDKNTNEFKYEKKDNSQVYTYVDKENPKLEEIKKFMAEKKIPDIFVAAEILGKKIVPVFQIEVKKNRTRAYIYFACEDNIGGYLNKWQYMVSDSISLF